MLVCADLDIAASSMLARVGACTSAHWQGQGQQGPDAWHAQVN